MGITIIGPTAAEFPKRVRPPIIQLKRLWSHNWSWGPDLEMVSAKLCASGQGVSSCEFRRRYGSIKQPWASDFASFGAWPDIAGWWVRLLMVGQEGYQTVWIGRVASETRDVHGTDNGPSGGQIWTAYGPERILQRIDVSTAFVETLTDLGNEVLEIDWVPPINNSDDRQAVIGNRTELKNGDSYVYEGDYAANGYVWSYYDYAEYLLDRFVDESASGGPAWVLGGQADLLADLDAAVDMDVTQTVAGILRKLIPLRLGLDYKIIPFSNDTDEGFQIYVYPLNATEWTFGEKTLPRNPNTVRIYSSQTSDNLRTTIERSDDEQYSRIRVLGRRVVSCCSLYATNSLPNPATMTASLEPKWSAALETEYEDGMPGAATTEQHENFRKGEKFRNVYQRFGAPATWDFHAYSALPILKDDGTLDVINTLREDTWPAHQTKIRRTLPWIPLREDMDYTTDPPTDLDTTGIGDLKPPMAWIARAHDATDRRDLTNLFPVDEEGISFSVSQTDFGVFFSTSPRHLLAEGHFTPVDATPAIWPQYDCDRLVVTLAFETDQRLALVAQLPESEGGVTGSGGTKDYEVPDAECWVLAPYTAIADGQHGLFTKLKLSGDKPRVLRNDSDKLALVMAGSLSRYYQQRARASIVIKGWLPWASLIGQILTVIEEGGSTHTIQAPITSVEWRGGSSPTTAISTGFAD